MNRDVTGIVTDFKRFAVHDGDGVRTTVFLKGCPLSCRWCHNPESIRKGPQLAHFEEKCLLCGECVRICPASVHRIEEGVHRLDRSGCQTCGRCADACPASALRVFGRTMSAEEVLRVVAEDKIFYRGTGGMTLSGGEPMFQPEFAAALLAGAREEGIGTALDTCGYAPREAYEKVLPYTDTFLFDLKHIDDGAHRQGTGCSNELILANLRFLSDSGARIEIRLPLIPGFNTDPDVMERTAEHLSRLAVTGVRLLPYHDLARSKYRALGMRDTMPHGCPPPQELLSLYESLLTARRIRVIG